MTNSTHGKPSSPPAKAATRLVSGGRDPFCASRLRQSAGLSRLHGSLPHSRGLSRPSRPLPLRPTRHPHVGGSRRRAGGPRRRALRRRCAAALRLGGGFGRAVVRPEGRRPRSGHRQRLSSHAEILRQRAGALRHPNELLRPARRRADRRLDRAQHPRHLHGIAGLAFIRYARRAGDRGRRPCQGRGCADGQHLGKPASISARSTKASIFRFNPAANISAAMPI